MKGTTQIITVVGATVFAIGCGLRAPRTEVTADDFDLAPLVGNWTGEYNSEETGRTGDVSFILRAGEVSADGRIELQAREPENVVVPADRPMVNGRFAAPSRQLLTIHFVRKEGNRVVGLLDPYTDPACACRVTTTFQGAFIDGRTIEGPYNTISSELARAPARGQWKVTRSKRL
jgi:hypothetical protein